MIHRLSPIAALMLAVLVVVPPARGADGLAPSGPPRLGLPLACQLGETCWLLNYPDADPGPAARDFTCGARTYDTHDGTDFALRDVAAAQRGVPVLAAADGKVVVVRDGEPDGLWLAGRQDEVKASGKECGNRVAIDHGGGWATDYCHLRQGSVTVKPGDMVRAGQSLGLVGLSGMTAFPHAHLSLLQMDGVRSRGVPADPFTGRPLTEGCGKPLRPVWSVPVPAERVSLYAAGFATAMPRSADLVADAGTPATVPADAPALIVWGAVFGAGTGDRVSIRITGPDGQEVAARPEILDRDQAWRWVSLGRKRPGAAWPPGTYGGTVSLERAGIPIQTRSVAVEVR